MSVVDWPPTRAHPQNPDAGPDWYDPRLPDFNLIWSTARAAGYAIGIHGSLVRDVDLIAAPWTDVAVSPEELITSLCRALNAREIGIREPKPHGRVAVNLQIDGWFKLIDLSIMPRSL